MKRSISYWFDALGCWIWNSPYPIELMISVVSRICFLVFADVAFKGHWINVKNTLKGYIWKYYTIKMTKRKWKHWCDSNPAHNGKSWRRHYLLSHPYIQQILFKTIPDFWICHPNALILTFTIKQMWTWSFDLARTIVMALFQIEQKNND